MNIECDTDTLTELESAFRFNDAVLRNMVISRKEAVTEQSLLIKRGDDSDRDDRQAAKSDDIKESVDDSAGADEGADDSTPPPEAAAEGDSVSAE